MNSMTGYGRATAPLGAHTVTVQVSSVNRKTLDLSVSLPDDWQTLEAAIGDRVRGVAIRGKVNLGVEVTGTNGGSATWDEAAAAATLRQLSAFAAGQGVPFEATPQLLWQIVSSQRGAAALPVVDQAEAVVLAAVDEALASFAAMRGREGATLLADFEQRLVILRERSSAIAERAPQVPATAREALLKRLRDAGLEIDLADERVLKEIALFADRCDITEEITRFRSHLDQIGSHLRAKGEIGRKAEFILQEMGREVHTTGAKANDLEIARHVIEMKNELERIREQMANVE